MRSILALTKNEGRAAGQTGLSSLSQGFLITHSSFFLKACLMPLLHLFEVSDILLKGVVMQAIKMCTLQSYQLFSTCLGGKLPHLELLGSRQNTNVIKNYLCIL